MKRTLAALFVLVGTLTVGSVTYNLAVLRPDATVAEAVDAGLLAVTAPARLRCRVRIAEECRVALGNLPRYAVFQVKARKSRPGTPEDFIAFDLPDAWQRCVRTVGTPDEACQLLEDGACTVPAVCGAGATPQLEVDACACRAAAGVCTVGGQPAKFGVTLAPGTWTGAGCVRKFCGPEVFGDDTSWPATCPGG